MQICCGLSVSLRLTASLSGELLFPRFPHVGAVAGGGLFAVADDGGLHELGVVEELVFLGALVVHIAHEVDLGALGVPVDQCVDAADGAQDAVKLAAGQAEAQQVDRLEFDPPPREKVWMVPSGIAP